MTRFSSGLRWLGASVLLLTASACATGNPEARRSAGPISRGELDSVNAFVVDEAVELLRPTWMARLQGACYAEEPLGREELSRLPLHDIREIRRISASEAVSECGISGMEMMASGTYLLILRRR